MASSLDLYNAIISLSPDIYWTLDEASGDAIQQGSLTTGNLVLSDSYTQAADELIPGDTTRFLSLTGGKGTASRGNLTLPVGSFSLTFLVRIPETITITSAAFFAIGAGGETVAANFQFLYRYTSYPTLSVFWEYLSGDNVDLTSEVQFRTNAANETEFEPVHVTLVKDAVNKTVTTYTNGRIREILTYSIEPTGGTSTSIFIGGTSAVAPAETLKMSIGHLACFQRVLTQQEVVNLTKASGFISAEYEIGQVEFEIYEQDLENFSTLTNIKNTLEYPANKLLTIALDPLIDPSLLEAGEAYTEE